MFGFRNPIELFLDVFPLLVFAGIVVLVVFILYKLGIINFNNKNIEHKVQYNTVNSNYQVNNVINYPDSWDDYVKACKNDCYDELWDKYWGNKIDKKDNKLYKNEWLSKYGEVIESPIKESWKKGIAKFECDDINYELEYYKDLYSKNFTSYEQFKNAWCYEYLSLKNALDNDLYDNSNAYVNSSLTASDVISGLSNLFSGSSNYESEEDRRIIRQQKALERRLDNQRPSVKDIREYNAVRKDRYGNLYTAGGTVIDKAAEELKKQSKKK